MTRLAIALGGNALIRRGEAGSTEVQRRNLVAAARGIVTLAEGSRAEIVITHGNGPQVGFLAIGAEMAASVVPAPPLDVLGAETQGQIGYLLANALNDAFLERGKRREIAVVVTRTVVPADDPAFANPTKPVGPIYDEETAREHARTRGWSIAPDGKSWRRVVPSPPPIRIVEASAIRTLVEAGVLVVASGGGGVPVVEQADGRYTGVEAVIDKDLASAVLAAQIGADILVISTGIEKACLNFGARDQRAIDTMTVAEAKRYIAEGHFAPGSMLPKVEACVYFAERRGGTAVITCPACLSAALDGRTGTRVTP
jgi:carbamate kinase